MFCQTVQCEAAVGKPLVVVWGVFLSTTSHSLLLLSSILKTLKRSPSEEAIEKAAVKGFDSLYLSLSAH